MLVDMEERGDNMLAPQAREGAAHGGDYDAECGISMRKIPVTNTPLCVFEDRNRMRGIDICIASMLSSSGRRNNVPFSCYDEGDRRVHMRLQARPQKRGGPILVFADTVISKYMDRTMKARGIRTQFISSFTDPIDGDSTVVFAKPFLRSRYMYNGMFDDDIIVSERMYRSKLRPESSMLGGDPSWVARIAGRNGSKTWHVILREWPNVDGPVAFPCTMDREREINPDHDLFKLSIRSHVRAIVSFEPDAGCDIFTIPKSNALCIKHALVQTIEDRDVKMFTSKRFAINMFRKNWRLLFFSLPIRGGIQHLYEIWRIKTMHTLVYAESIESTPDVSLLLLTLNISCMPNKRDFVRTVLSMRSVRAEPPWASSPRPIAAERDVTLVRMLGDYERGADGTRLASVLSVLRDRLSALLRSCPAGGPLSKKNRADLVRIVRMSRMAFQNKSFDVRAAIVFLENTVHLKARGDDAISCPVCFEDSEALTSPILLFNPGGCEHVCCRACADGISRGGPIVGISCPVCRGVVRKIAELRKLPKRGRDAAAATAAEEERDPLPSETECIQSIVESEYKTGVRHAILFYSLPMRRPFVDVSRMLDLTVDMVNASSPGLLFVSSARCIIMTSPIPAYDCDSYVNMADIPIRICVNAACELECAIARATLVALAQRRGVTYEDLRDACSFA
jgi:hypothetical protein